MHLGLMIGRLWAAQGKREVTERGWGIGPWSGQPCPVLDRDDRQGVGADLGGLYRGGIMEGECLAGSLGGSPLQCGQTDLY